MYASWHIHSVHVIVHCSLNYRGKWCHVVVQPHEHDASLLSLLQAVIGLLPPIRPPTLLSLWPPSHLASMTPAPQPMEALHLTPAVPPSPGKQDIQAHYVTSALGLGI